LLGPLDYVLWLAGFLSELVVVACIFYRRAFLRYYAVAAYMFSAAVVQVVEFAAFREYGVSSRQYHFSYYYLENLLTILLFFVVVQLCHRVFALMDASRYMRVAAFLLLIGSALISYLVVRGHRGHLTEEFAIEFGQTLYFVGVILTYILWIVILRLREKPARLVQLVLALGIYFSATACVYALRNLFPGLEGSVMTWGLPLGGLWLPVAWTYTFLRTPDDAPSLSSAAGVSA
jgi:hypothetical protein